MSSHSFVIHVVTSFPEAQYKSAQVFLESTATNIALKNGTTKIALQAGENPLSAKQTIYLRSQSSTKKASFVEKPPLGWKEEEEEECSYLL